MSERSFLDAIRERIEHSLALGAFPKFVPLPTDVVEFTSWLEWAPSVASNYDLEWNF